MVALPLMGSAPAFMEHSPEGTSLNDEMYHTMVPAVMGPTHKGFIRFIDLFQFGYADKGNAT